MKRMMTHFNVIMQNVSRKRILNQHAFLTEILRHLSTKYLFGCFHVVEFQQRQWNPLVKLFILNGKR